MKITMKNNTVRFHTAYFTFTYKSSFETLQICNSY